MNKLHKQIAACAVMSLFAYSANAANVLGVNGNPATPILVQTNILANTGDFITGGDTQLLGGTTTNGIVNDGTIDSTGTITVQPDSLPSAFTPTAGTAGQVDNNIQAATPTTNFVVTRLGNTVGEQESFDQSGVIIEPNGDVTLKNNDGTTQTVELVRVTRFQTYGINHPVPAQIGQPVPGTQEYLAGYLLDSGGTLIDPSNVDANGDITTAPGYVLGDPANEKAAFYSLDIDQDTTNGNPGDTFATIAALDAYIAGLAGTDLDTVPEFINDPLLAGQDFIQEQTTVGNGGNLTVEGDSNLTGVVTTDVNGDEQLNDGNLNVAGDVDATGTVLENDDGSQSLAGGTISANNLELTQETLNDGLGGTTTEGGNLTVGGATTTNGIVNTGDVATDTLTTDTILDSNGDNLISSQGGGQFTIGSGSFVGQTADTYNGNPAHSLTINQAEPLVIGDGVGGMSELVFGESISVDGNLDGTAEFSVDGTTGNVVTAGTLTVAGATDLNGDLDVQGNSNLQGNLVVAGTTTLNDTLQVNADTDLNGDLDVQGNSNLQGNLVVAGTTTLNDTLQVNADTDLNGDLDVQGNSNLQGNLVVAGTTTLNDTLQVNADTDLNGALDVQGAANLQDTLTVAGATDLNSTLDVQGAANLQDTLTVAGATDLNSTLDVQGAANLQNTLTVAGATDLNSTLDVAGLSRLDGGINVNSGEFTVNSATGNVYTDGDLDVNGFTTTDGLQNDGTFTNNGFVDINGSADVRDNLQVGGNANVDGILSLSDNGFGGVDDVARRINQNASNIASNKRKIDENSRGIAMVAALQHTTVLPGMTNALDVGAAYFEGETGMSINYARRINENWQINFGAASTTDFDESVIKAGVGVQW